MNDPVGQTVKVLRTDEHGRITKWMDPDARLVRGPDGRGWIVPIPDDRPGGEWWMDHRNLALLLRWREYQDLTEEPASAVLEEPWHSTEDFGHALLWNHDLLHGSEDR